LAFKNIQATLLQQDNEFRTAEAQERLSIPQVHGISNNPLYRSLIKKISKFALLLMQVQERLAHKELERMRRECGNDLEIETRLNSNPISTTQRIYGLPGKYELMQLIWTKQTINVLDIDPQWWLFEDSDGIYTANSNNQLEREGTIGRTIDILETRAQVLQQRFSCLHDTIADRTPSQQIAYFHNLERFLAENHYIATIYDPPMAKTVGRPKGSTSIFAESESSRNGLNLVPLDVNTAEDERRFDNSTRRVPSNWENSQVRPSVGGSISRTSRSRGSGRDTTSRRRSVGRSTDRLQRGRGSTRGSRGGRSTGGRGSRSDGTGGRGNGHSNNIGQSTQSAASETTIIQTRSQTGGRITRSQITTLL
jgi:hypothetical protein